MLVELVLLGLAATTLIVVGAAIVELLRAEPPSHVLELTDTTASPERVGRRT